MMELSIPLIGHLHEHVYIAQLGKDDLAANQICEKRCVASVTTIDLPHGVMSTPNHPQIEKAGFNAVALLNCNQAFARNPSASTKLNCNSIAQRFSRDFDHIFCKQPLPFRSNVGLTLSVLESLWAGFQTGHVLSS